MQLTSHLLHDVNVDEGKYPEGHDPRHDDEPYCKSFPVSGQVAQ